MPYAGYMKLLYRKGSANEADPVSRRPDFYSIWWDGEVPNEPEHAVEACLALTAEEISVDEDFKDKLIAAYKVTKYFDDNGPWKKMVWYDLMIYICIMTVSLYQDLLPNCVIV